MDFVARYGYLYAPRCCTESRSTGLARVSAREHDGIRQMLRAYPSAKRLDMCGSRFDGQPIRISD